MPARLSRTLHKWLALTVGMQAILWLASGFYMVVVDLDFIHGDTLVRNLAIPPPRATAWYSLNELRSRFADIQQVRVKGLPGFDRPLYEVKVEARLVLADAVTGQVLSPLAESRIAELARLYYAGRGSLGTVELLVGESPLEIQSRSLPLWRAQFDDWHETTLYIHPDSGELVTRRHRLWRWFDALWMLHIMDYETRTNVNNLPLKIFTIGGLVFVISGAWLLCFSFRRRQARSTG